MRIFKILPVIVLGLIASNIFSKWGLYKGASDENLRKPSSVNVDDMVNDDSIVSLPDETDIADGQQKIQNMETYISNMIHLMGREESTIVLPCSHANYRILQREDVRAAAPRGFGRNVYFMMKNGSELSQYEVGIFQDHVASPHNHPPMILALSYIMYVKPNLSYVIVMECQRDIYWLEFVDRLLADMTIINDGYACFTADGVECGSYVSVYSYRMIDYILTQWETISDDWDLYSHQNWFKWLDFLGLTRHMIEGVVGPEQTDQHEMMMAMYNRDPRYDDVRNASYSRYDFPDKEATFLRRFQSSIDYTPLPTWIYLPIRECIGRNGVWMIESAPKSRSRRMIYRKLMKAYGIQDYYFILGTVEKPEIMNGARQEAVDYDDIIIYNYPDKYDNLTYKGFAAMSYIKDHCVEPAAFVKLDHDIAIDLGLLPMISGKMGCPNAQINFGKFPKIACLFGMFSEGEALRGGLTQSSYSWPVRVWPFAAHPRYCSGPTYMIQNDAMLKIFDALRSFSWTGNTDIAFKAAYSNEDVSITGRFRAMVGEGNIAHYNVGVQHYNRYKDVEFEEAVTKELDKKLSGLECSPYESLADIPVLKVANDGTNDLVDELKVDSVLNEKEVSKTEAKLVEHQPTTDVNQTDDSKKVVEAVDESKEEAGKVDDDSKKSVKQLDDSKTEAKQVDDSKKEAKQVDEQVVSDLEKDQKVDSDSKQDVDLKKEAKQVDEQVVSDLEKDQKVDSDSKQDVDLKKEGGQVDGDSKEETDSETRRGTG